jgi:hypothetical protein
VERLDPKPLDRIWRLSSRTDDCVGVIADDDLATTKVGPSKNPRLGSSRSTSNRITPVVPRLEKNWRKIEPCL